MTKSNFNQNGKYVQKLIDIIEPDFFFNNKPINRFNVVEGIINNTDRDKSKKLSKLRQEISSIENCNNII